MLGKMDVIVSGVSLCDEYDLVLSNFAATPPEPKFYEIDVPGGDSIIDTTESLSGDVSYSQRKFEFEFFVEDSVSQYEKTKTSIMSFLHGKKLTFSLSWDAGYLYTGRFKVSMVKSYRSAGRITISVKAEPYKTAGSRVVEVDAQAGAYVSLSPGRGRVQPVFQCSMPLHVISNGIDVTLPAGTHTAVGLWVQRGASDVYVNSSGSASIGNTAWSDLAGKRWGDLAGKRWHEIGWMGGSPPANASYSVKISYEIKEL